MDNPKSTFHSQNSWTCVSIFIPWVLDRGLALLAALHISLLSALECAYQGYTAVYTSHYSNRRLT